MIMQPFRHPSGHHVSGHILVFAQETDDTFDVLVKFFPESCP